MTTRDLQQRLQRQKEAVLRDGPVPAAVRADRLQRLAKLLREHQDALLQALCADFGHRSIDHGRLTEIAVPIMEARQTARQVAGWMRPERRPVPLPQAVCGARAWVQYQPLGSIGIIVPWNYPIYLAAGPLIGVLAAGNRAMLKPSEHAPRVAGQLAELFPRYFDATEIDVVTGDADTSVAFSALPFDHLVFTGAGAIGRHVMAAAARNLVPVTLELGGKSPVIIGRDANLADAALKIMDFKLANAGQTCIAPDYLLVQREQLEAVIEALRAATARLFPTLLTNPDYSSIIDARHRERLQRYIDDARTAGVRCVELNPAGEPFDQQPDGLHKMVPRLFIDPADDRLIMREEIFGPLLPIRTYGDIDDAVAYVNGHDRPLALYYFGPATGTEVERVLARTISGGVTINDVAAHAGCESLPFGGVGPSGLGCYHGRDGFRQFSHAKAVFRQGRIDLGTLFGFRAPYGEKFRGAVRRLMG